MIESSVDNSIIFYDDKNFDRLNEKDNKWCNCKFFTKWMCTV